MKKILMIALLFCSIGSTTFANNCKKGKPCGKSCISKNDVCHKDNAVSDVKSSDSNDTKSGGIGSTENAKPEKSPTCLKGKPCGDSCIPKDKTCHK